MSRPKPPGCTCTTTSSLNRVQALADDIRWANHFPWNNRRRLVFLSRKLYLLSKERLELAMNCPYHREERR